MAEEKELLERGMADVGADPHSRLGSGLSEPRDCGHPTGAAAEAPAVISPTNSSRRPRAVVR